jgi:uncharacterized protein (UPF0333 family)
MNLYSDVLVKGIFGEIIKVRDSKALSATIIMTYVAIDTMAFLSMAIGKPKNNSTDFISWVDNYLKTDLSQPYQYDGKDMWGARCAKLHSYSSDSDYAQKNKCKIYGYQNGGDHLYVPKESQRLVLISTYRLVSDFGDALISFLRDASKNSDLKNRIDQRLEKVCQQFEIKNEFIKKSY